MDEQLNELVMNLHAFSLAKVDELRLNGIPCSLMGYIAMWELFRKETQLDGLNEQQIYEVFMIDRMNAANVTDVSFTEH